MRGEYQHLPSSSLYFFCRSSPLFSKPRNEEQAHPYPGGRSSQNEFVPSVFGAASKFNRSLVPLTAAMPLPVTGRKGNRGERAVREFLSVPTKRLHPSSAKGVD